MDQSTHHAQPAIIRGRMALISDLKFRAAGGTKSIHAISEVHDDDNNIITILFIVMRTIMRATIDPCWKCGVPNKEKEFNFEFLINK